MTRTRKLTDNIGFCVSEDNGITVSICNLFGFPHKKFYSHKIIEHKFFFKDLSLEMIKDLRKNLENI